MEAQRNGAQRAKRIKAKRRTRKEFDRIYGSRERVRKINAMPCCNCGKYPSENAHTEGGGTGRKAGWRTIADLCAWCHRLAPNSYHALGSAEAFRLEHGTDLIARAAVLAVEVPA